MGSLCWWYVFGALLRTIVGEAASGMSAGVFTYANALCFEVVAGSAPLARRERPMSLGSVLRLFDVSALDD